MKKRILVVFFGIITALMLSACHGAKQLPPFSVPENFDETKQYEITFWAKNDTNKTQTNIYNKAVSDFESIYPNIKVNIRLYTDYGRIYNDVITNISTQTTPNVCVTYPDHIATYITGENVVAPLDALINDKNFGLGGEKLKFEGPLVLDMIPEFLNECRINGVTYCIPYMRSTEACYINEDLVKKLGYEVPEALTWDFIWEVSDKAMEKDADGNFVVNGQKVMIPFIYKSTDNMMIQVLKQKNAEYSDASGNIGLFNDVTWDFLYEIKKHAEKKSFSTFKISSYPGNFLNAGQCIFAIDSTAGATWMGSKAPLSDISADAIVEFKTVVRTIPQYDTENPVMISQGPSICVFNKNDPDEVLASWLFAQFLLTNEVQINYAETEGYVPVTKTAQSSPEYLDYLSREGEPDEKNSNNKYYDVKIQATKLLLNNMENTFVTPVFNGSASLRDAAGQMIENVVKSVNRGQTVDDKYMYDLKEDIISLYRLDSLSAQNGNTVDTEEGSLPKSSIAMLIVIVIVWILMAIYLIFMILKKKNQQI